MVGGLLTRCIGSDVNCWFQSS